MENATSCCSLVMLSRTHKLFITQDPLLTGATETKWLRIPHQHGLYSNVPDLQDSGVS